MTTNGNIQDAQLRASNGSPPASGRDPNPHQQSNTSEKVKNAVDFFYNLNPDKYSEFFCSSGEAANILKLTKCSIRRLINEGKLIAVKGGHYHIYKPSIREYLRSQN